MTELSIKIKIGDREYPMKVRHDQERRLRMAGKLVNEKLNNLKKNFSIEDKTDLLAMVAFDAMVKALQLEEELSDLQDQTASKLKQYEAVIDSVITSHK